MQVYNGQISWQLSLAEALAQAAREYRPATAAELTTASTELGRIVGKKEAASPEWARRIVIVRESGKPGLLVNYSLACADYGTAYIGSDFLATVPVVAPLAEAAKLLESDANPELESLRRQKYIDDTRAKQEAQYRQEYERQQREAAVQRQLEAERKQWRADAWDALPPTAQIFASLAFATEDGAKLPSTMSELARHAAKNAGRLPYPRREWWKALEEGGA